MRVVSRAALDRSRVFRVWRTLQFKRSLGTDFAFHVRCDRNVPGRIEVRRGDLLHDVRADAVVNSANESLEGAQFPYFPLSPDCEDGESFFPLDVVDGQLHALAGPGLAVECSKLPELEDGPLSVYPQRCEVGGARLTGAHGDLLCRFRCVIHAVAPLWEAEDEDEVAESVKYLRSANDAALSRAAEAGFGSVALPLLGSGAKKFPLAIAARCASEAAVAHLRSGTSLERVVFVSRKANCVEALMERLSLDFDATGI